MIELIHFLRELLKCLNFNNNCLILYLSFINKRGVNKKEMVINMLLIKMVHNVKSETIIEMLECNYKLDVVQGKMIFSNIDNHDTLYKEILIHYIYDVIIKDDFSQADEVLQIMKAICDIKNVRLEVVCKLGLK